MIVYQDEVNTVHHANAREVAAAEEPGSFSLAVFDGPYGMAKADWDRVKVADLPEWYAPHFDDADRLLGASASLYVWNTAEGWAALHPGLVAQGWEFRSLIVWDKGGTPAVLNATAWPEVFEVCGFYSRGDIACFASETGIWRMAPSSFAAEKFRGDGVLRSVKDGYEWAAPLHPCQKPTAFADRIIRASTRPGERVWVPFGGTCREAVAAQRIARDDPSEARRVVTCEIDQDGRDYLGAVVRQLRGDGVQRRDPRQADLFGSAK